MYLLIIIVLIILIYYNYQHKEFISEKDLQLRRWSTGEKMVRVYEEIDFEGDYIELPVGRYNIDWIPTKKEKRPLRSIGSVEFLLHPGYISLLGLGVRLHETTECDDKDILTSDIIIRSNQTDLEEYFKHSEKRYEMISCIEVLERSYSFAPQTSRFTYYYPSYEF